MAGGLGALRRLLIANRGEIARRVARTARALGVEDVRVWSQADSHGPHAVEARRGANLGGASAAESYLQAERLVDAAKRHGCQAVHPGYGFLSENEAFAEAVEGAGLAWVGPPSAAIRAMGCKQKSKRIMVAADVPVVPGYHGDDQSAERLREEARVVGYPVMLKATRGGGGKGMRVVETEADFDGALESARREALNSFGDDGMILEKLVRSPRHVEVQICCDAHGNAVYLHERDCSAQRRHQKVLEEAPAPSYLPQSARVAMGEAAVAAARAIGYRNAGTVEFLVDGATNEFYFMETNTRLQVEHPVTEAITGQDLVEWQLRVAMGEELPLRQEDIPLEGHAFEARIYAERSTPQGFLPSTGTLLRWRPPTRTFGAEFVRVDSAVEEGSEVSPLYDPMLAKLIVKADSRPLALTAMGDALRDFEVAGVHTNIRLLRQLCEQPEVIDGTLTTDYLDRKLADVLETPIAPADAREVARVGAAAAAAHADAAGASRGSAAAASAGGLSRAWATRDAFVAHDGAVTAGNAVRLDEGGEVSEHAAILQGADSVAVGDWHVAVANSKERPDGGVESQLRVQAPNGDTLALSALVGAQDGDSGRAKVWVWGEEHAEFVSLPPSGVEAALAEGAGAAAGTGRVGSPMPGKVVKVHAALGDSVEAGDVLLELEAMKMVHRVCADVDGVVTQLADEGGLVKDGEVIATVEPADAEK